MAQKKMPKFTSRITIGWWPFSGKKGLSKEASRQGWDEAITRLTDWLIFNPSELAERKWGLMENALRCTAPPVGIESADCSRSGRADGLRQTEEKVGLSADESARGF